MVGKRIGEFEIKGEIGRGGMGIVYGAYQPSLDREVAIKILPPNLVHDEELVERFLREARAAAKLNHPNIVTIYQVNQQDDFYYFAMENVSGGSLHDLIKKRGPLPLDESLIIINRVAEGLDYAHRKGIIHRDIKPGNILLDEDERPVITDFGIAKATFDQALTKTGVSFGSPEYMAPEQFKGLPADKRADLYSLGILFYQMLTGYVPFKGDTAVSTAFKHVNEPVPSIQNIRPDIPAWVDGVLNNLLAKEPANRFGSAAELIECLTTGSVPGFADKNPVPAAKSIPEPHTPSPSFYPEEEPWVKQAVSPSSVPSAVKPPADSSRKKMLIVLGAMLTTLAAVIIAVVLSSGGNSTPPFAGGGGAGGGSGGAVQPVSPPSSTDLSRVVPSADAILRAIHSKDVGAFLRMAGPDFRNQVGQLTDEKSRNIIDNMERISLESGRLGSPLEIRKAADGRMYAALSRGENILILVLEKTGGRYGFRSTGYLTRDEFTRLPLASPYE